MSSGRTKQCLCTTWGIKDENFAYNCCPLHAPADTVTPKYSCYQLLTVERIDKLSGVQGCLPILLLPKSLIGKTVKVSIEEVQL